MLHHTQTPNEPAAMERAIDSVIVDPKRRTGDLGGPLGTAAFTAEVVQALANA